METLVNSYKTSILASSKAEKLIALRKCWDELINLRSYYSTKSNLGISSELVKTTVNIKYSKYTKPSSLTDALDKAAFLESELSKTEGSANSRYICKMIYELISYIYEKVDIELSLLSLD